MQIRSRQSSAAPWKEETNLTNLANLITVVYTDGADALSFVCFIHASLAFLVLTTSFSLQIPSLQTSLSKLNKLTVLFPVSR